MALYHHDQIITDVTTFVTDAFYPDLSLLNFKATLISDEIQPESELHNILQLSITDNNSELLSFKEAQQQLGYLSLADIPADLLNGETILINYYRHACYYLARARIAQNCLNSATYSQTTKNAELIQSRIHQQQLMWRHHMYRLTNQESMRTILL